MDTVNDPTMARLKAVTVGDVEHRPVVLAEPDPTWPDRYAHEARQIADVLGDTLLGIHHVGSTAVPDLPAKPIIDILLLVADPTAEASYVPPLRQIGYELRIREPDWYDHRLLRPRAHHDVNAHVFAPGCPEVARMLRFRDHLRSHDDHRRLYADTKRALARRDWPTVQHYADAKTDVIRAILEQDGPA